MQAWKLNSGLCPCKVCSLLPESHFQASRQYFYMKKGSWKKKNIHKWVTWSSELRWLVSTFTVGKRSSPWGGTCHHEACFLCPFNLISLWGEWYPSTVFPDEELPLQRASLSIERHSWNWDPSSCDPDACVLIIMFRQFISQVWLCCLQDQPRVFCLLLLQRFWWPFLCMWKVFQMISWASPGEKSYNSNCPSALDWRYRFTHSRCKV